MKSSLLFVLFFGFLISCQSSRQENVPGFDNPKVPPHECTLWFDGCNECRAHKGHIVSCSLMSCFKTKAPKCLKYTTGPSDKSVKLDKCKKENGVLQKNRAGHWVCLQETTDAHLPCDTSQECQSLCLYYTRQKRGFCSKYKPFIGCGQEYKNGQHFQVCN